MRHRHPRPLGNLGHRLRRPRSIEQPSYGLEEPRPMRAQLLRSLGRLQPIRGHPAIQCGKRLRSNDGDVTIAIKAMRDITSGHLRSSGGTKHLCLGLLGTLWFTRGRLPQVQATLQSVSITLSYFFHLLGLFGPLQPERRHFPSVWGLLSVDSAAGLLRGGISSDQCHCGRPKTVVARHMCTQNHINDYIQ